MKEKTCLKNNKNSNIVCPDYSGKLNSFKLKLKTSKGLKRNNENNKCINQEESVSIIILKSAI